MDVVRTFDWRREGYAHLRLLDGATLESVEALLEQAPVLRARGGETILGADQANEVVYILLSGTLRVDLSEDPEGPALTHIGRGECVGELSVIDGSTTSARVRAVDDAELLALRGEEVLRMADRSHAVARNLLRLLSTRIRGANRLVRERANESEVLRAHAITDALTGLYNRRWLDETLSRMAGRADHPGAQAAASAAFAVLLIDVDHFKRVNDTWGHLVGDRVLQRIAEALRASLRPTDFAARYGGEELVALLPQVGDEAAAVSVAERIRRSVAAVEIATEARPAIAITVSIGAAVRRPHESGPELLARADAALYRAKQAGRDRTETGTG